MLTTMDLTTPRAAPDRFPLLSDGRPRAPPASSESNGRGYSAIANGLAVSKPMPPQPGRYSDQRLEARPPLIILWHLCVCSRDRGHRCPLWQHSEASPDVAADAVDELFALLVRAALMWAFQGSIPCLVPVSSMRQAL